MEKETNVCKTDALRIALWRLATGYEVEETEIIASKGGRPPKIKKRKHHIPPSLEAAREYQRLYGKLGPVEE